MFKFKVSNASILENCFEVALRLETNVLSVWKWHFSLFTKFWIDKVEVVFCKSQTKSSKLLQAKAEHRKHFRKWFWSYLDMPEPNILFVWKLRFHILQIFESLSWNCYLGKPENALETFQILWLLLGAFWKVISRSYLIFIGHICNNFLIFQKFWIFNCS